MQDCIEIRELRRHLALYIDGQRAILIGDGCHHRALLIPLTRHATYNLTEQKKAIARAAKESQRMLGELRNQLRR
jgi:hypothetical protein